MLDEIREQPLVLELTLKSELDKILALRQRFLGKRPSLIVLAARGTSNNAAQFARYLLELTTGIPVSFAAPSIVTLYGARVDLTDALVIGVSQSGESTDINMVLDHSRECGALSIGITTNPDSPLARLADVPLVIQGGQELSIAATKSYTSQILLLYLIAYSLGAPLSLDDLRRLPDSVSTALNLENDVQLLAAEPNYIAMTRCLVVGRGINYANALELGLKLMETCYVLAKRLSGAELLHGPIAIVDSTLPVFAFSPAGATWSSVRQLLAKLKLLGPTILAISDSRNRSVAGYAQHILSLPNVSSPRDVTLPDDLYTAIPYAVPAQLFACFLSINKGLDPDQPRGLSKITKTL
jgi:glucosamine--fructose-6-phosphate aminotransferase (isomerizing)